MAADTHGQASVPLEPILRVAEGPNPKTSAEPVAAETAGRPRVPIRLTIKIPQPAGASPSVAKGRMNSSSSKLQAASGQLTTHDGPSKLSVKHAKH